MTTENPQTPGNLGQRMRQRRQEKGWTQEQLAVRAGTNQAVIQKIENGKSLRPRKIDQIAAVLDVSVEAVESLLSRARRRMASQLAAFEGA